jgi:hypothetical protein
MDKLGAAQNNKAFIFLSMLIGIAINVTFIVLFILKSADEADNTSCQSLLSWDKGLYISMIIYVVASFFDNLYKISSAPVAPTGGLYTLFSFLNGASGLSSFVCWIGIQVVYFNLEVSGVCNALGTVNFAYIIVNYVLIGLVVLTCFCVCCCGVCLMSIMGPSNDVRQDYTAHLEQDKA